MEIKKRKTKDQGWPVTDMIWTEEGEPKEHPRTKAKVGNKIEFIEDYWTSRVSKGTKGDVVKVTRREKTISGKVRVYWLYGIKFENSKRSLQLEATTVWVTV